MRLEGQCKLENLKIVAVETEGHRQAGLAFHGMDRLQVDVANVLRELSMNQDGILPTLAACQDFLHVRDSGGIKDRFAGCLQCGLEFVIPEIPTERFPKINTGGVE